MKRLSLSLVLVLVCGTSASAQIVSGPTIGQPGLSTGAAAGQLFYPLPTQLPAQTPSPIYIPGHCALAIPCPFGNCVTLQPVPCPSPPQPAQLPSGVQPGALLGAVLEQRADQPAPLPAPGTPPPQPAQLPAPEPREPIVVRIEVQPLPVTPAPKPAPKPTPKPAPKMCPCP